MSRNLSAVFKYRISLSIVVILLATMLFSCENDMMAVVKLSSKDSIPDVTINNVHVKQSEKGKMTFELIAPKMISFQTRDAYTELPAGLKMIFFDSIMQPKSEITATSLSGATPFFTEYIKPVFPVLARESIFGVFATSRGVLLPKVLIGKSPIPSIATKISFNVFASSMLELARLAYYFFR